MLPSLQVDSRPEGAHALVRRIAPGKMLKMNVINEVSVDPEAGLAAKLDRLAEVLEDVQFAILFGSLVSGAVRKDSDVDLAVMYPSLLDSHRLIRLVGEVSAVFCRDVDLVDLRRAGPILKMQVLKNGRPVVVNDTGAFERFRMYTPAEYSDFKLRRRPVEEALTLWGTS